MDRLLQLLSQVMSLLEKSNAGAAKIGFINQQHVKNTVAISRRACCHVKSRGGGRPGGGRDQAIGTSRKVTIRGGAISDNMHRCLKQERASRKEMLRCAEAAKKKAARQQKKKKHLSSLCKATAL